MNIAALREYLESTLGQLAEERRLAALLAELAAGLHRSLRLPAAHAAESLQDFVTAYVQEVPRLLAATGEAVVELDDEARVGRALRVAEQFLLAPPANEDALAKLENLLSGAYLSHRLVEEINDRHSVRGARPLLPLDATLANLVAHQLLGESFANQLDAVVERIGDGLLGDDLFASSRRETGQRPAAAESPWPDPARQAGIELRLPTGPTQWRADPEARCSAG